MEIMRYLIQMDEEQIEEFHQECKIKYKWSKLEDKDKVKCALEIIHFCTLSEFIDEHLEDLYDIFFHNELALDSRYAMKNRIRAHIKEMDEEELLELVWKQYGIKDETEWLSCYHDELYEYFDLEHSKDIWIEGDGYNILHIDAFYSEYEKRIEPEWTKRIIDHYMLEHHISSIDDLSLDNKIDLYHLCCDKIF